MYVFLFRSEEPAIFDGVFIAKDDDVARFVDYVHSSTNHVSLHNFIIFTYKTKRTLFEQVWTVLTIFHVLGLWKRCLWRAVVSGA